MSLTKFIKSPPSELLIAEQMMAAGHSKRDIHQAVRDHMGVTKPLKGYSFHVWCAIREKTILRHRAKLPRLTKYLRTLTVRGDQIRTACRERQARIASTAKAVSR